MSRYIPTRQAQSPNLVAPPRKQYNSAAGDYRLNQRVGEARIIRPDIQNGGQLVMRIWPMLDPSRPTENLLPGRTDATGTTGLTGMSLSEPVTVVSFAGISSPDSVVGDGSKFSYIVGFANENASPFSASKMEESDPYVVLQNTVMQGARQLIRSSSPPFGWEHRWEEHIPRMTVNNAAVGTTDYRKVFLPRVQTKYYAVATIFENGSQLNLYGSKVGDKMVQRNGNPYGYLDSDPVYIVELPAASVGLFLSFLTLMKPDCDLETPYQNPSDLFVTGEPTGYFDPATGIVHGGKFITFFRPDVQLTLVNIGNHISAFDHLPRSRNPAEKGSPYFAAVSDTYSYNGITYTASMPPEQTKQVFAKHRYFFQEGEVVDNDTSYFLEMLDIEKKCEIVARGFSKDPAILRFGWSSHPEYLAFPDVHRILTAASQVSMHYPYSETSAAGGSPASHQPQPQAYQPQPQAYQPQSQAYQPQPQAYQPPPQAYQPQPQAYQPPPQAYQPQPQAYQPPSQAYQSPPPYAGAQVPSMPYPAASGATPAYQSTLPHLQTPAEAQPSSAVSLLATDPTRASVQDGASVYSGVPVSAGNPPYPGTPSAPPVPPTQAATTQAPTRPAGGISPPWAQASSVVGTAGQSSTPARPEQPSGFSAEDGDDDDYDEQTMQDTFSRLQGIAPRDASVPPPPLPPAN